MSLVNLINTPVVIHNLHGPDSSVDRRHRTIFSFLKAVEGGLGGFNELNSSDLAYLRDEATRLGLKVFRHGEDGVVWDPSIFTAGTARVKKIMTGGFVGADGIHTAYAGDDDRRVGPNRYAIYIPFEIKAVALKFEFVVTHTVAKAFTTEVWRLGLFRRSIASLGAGIQLDDGILVGDMNKPTAINLPHLMEVPVKTPASMGNAHYDQILRWGSHISVRNVSAVNTPSDHHMIVATASFYRAGVVSVPSTVPKVVLPKPGDSNVDWLKQGAPVRHPWAERSPRWKRRHKRLWARILKWQTAYRRRL